MADHPIARALAEAALTREAELAAQGWRFCSVAWGDPETPAEAGRQSAVAAAFWSITAVSNLDLPPVVTGGNDYATCCAHGPDADPVLNQVELLARELNPGWWHVNRSFQPDFTGANDA